MVDRTIYRTNPEVFQADEWTHVTAVIGPDDFEIYINEKKVEGSIPNGTALLPP